MPGVTEILQLASQAARAGEVSHAADLYREVLALSPANPQALNGLGELAFRVGRLEEAGDYVARAIALAPNEPVYHNNLCGIRRQQGRLDEAAACCQRAIELAPNSPLLYSNLGVVQVQLGNFEQAMASFLRAVGLEPKLAAAHFNLANAYSKLDRLDLAEASYRRALELEPNHAAIHFNLANCLQSHARLDEAVAEFRLAIQLDPSRADYGSNLLYALHFHPGGDAETIFAEHRAWARTHADPLTARSGPHLNDRSPDRRLRVGYVSAHFRDHAINFFSEPILAAHDHQAFEMFCYSAVPPADLDAVTARLQGYADQWRDITGLSDEQAAERIRGDRIDILVDLDGHLGGNRLLVFARKPAPVQVTYIGYQNTTGMLAMDYRLTDAWADPPGTTDRWYTEKLVRLPGAFFCFQPSAAALDVVPPPAMASGAVTFGSLNNYAKITPVLSTWAEILAQVPGSRLVLLAPLTDTVRRQVNLALEPFKLSADRVELAGRRPRGEYFQLISRIDIALDPFPFDGHTTNCDCLWQGVPVVTLAGDAYASRYGAAPHVNLGLRDLIASSRDEYVSIAGGLAGDLPRLAALRAELRSRMQNSPLLDFAGFTRNLEAAYRRMWIDWCAKAVT